MRNEAGGPSLNVSESGPNGSCKRRELFDGYGDDVGGEKGKVDGLSAAGNKAYRARGEIGCWI